MARPLSEAKRQAIITAAIAAIAMEGVGTPTSRIARAAGVAEGTLFTYFKTKEVLFSDLYRILKREITTVLLDGYPELAPRRSRLDHVWHRYIGWGLNNPERHRALQQLSLSDRISAETLSLTGDPLAVIADLIAESIGARGDMPLGYAQATMTALADATIDHALREPEAATACIAAGSAGLDRLLSGT